MKNLFWQIVVSILTIFLAVKFVPGVTLQVIPGKSVYFGIRFTQNWQILIFIGIILGLINSFIKPILNLITLPLKIITLGLFSLILNMAIFFFLDVIFPELKIAGLSPLFFTVLILWILKSLFKVS
jgi:putative membrane protein